MSDNRTRVLYVAGIGRSGSTLLAKLLGELDGFINVGEAARYLFNTPMMLQNLPCSCGSELSDCVFWQDIAPRIDRRTQEFAKDILRIRYLPLLMSVSLVQPGTFQEQMEDLLPALERLYVSIAEKTGGDVIVDSSKHPSIAYVLSRIPNVELYVIHLVRNPQGVVHSWSKPKEYLPAFSPLTIILRWIAFNLSSELLRFHAKMYRLIRYEDLVNNPKGTLDKIGNAVTSKSPDMDFLHDNQARITLQHALAGNPDKLIQGTLHIKERDWYLPWHVRPFLCVLAFPLLYRYKYLFARTFRTAKR